MSLMLAGGHVPCMALGLRLESPAQRMQRAEHNCRTKTGEVRALASESAHRILKPLVNPRVFKFALR